MAQHLCFCVQEIWLCLTGWFFFFCLNQMRSKLKAIQPKEIHSKVGFKLKSCKHSNQMYSTFQKTQKITFTSNKIMIIDVEHGFRPWKWKGQRSRGQSEHLCQAYPKCFRSLSWRNLRTELVLYPNIQKKKKKKNITEPFISMIHLLYTNSWLFRKQLIPLFSIHLYI